MTKATVIKRIVFGSVMIAVLAGILWLDWRWEKQYKASHPGQYTATTRGIPLIGVLLPLLWVGFIEFSRLARSAGVAVHMKSGLLGITILIALPILNNITPFLTGIEPLFDFLIRSPDINPQLCLAVIALLIFAEQMISGRLDNALRRVACTLLGVIYLGLCGGIILSLCIHFGVAVLVMFLAAVKCADIGAYFTGSLLGRHKMIPWLSPGKSWEGLAGGLVVAGVVSVLAWRLMAADLPPGLFGNGDAWCVAAIFGVVVGMAGQFGDLCESLLKRSAGLKDSGSVVPEFGGVLDIVDSPLLAAPVAYVLLLLL